MPLSHGGGHDPPEVRRPEAAAGVVDAVVAAAGDRAVVLVPRNLTLSFRERHGRLSRRQPPRRLCSTISVRMPITASRSISSCS